MICIYYIYIEYIQSRRRKLSIPKKIMNTVCSPNYHHNGFIETCALRAYNKPYIVCPKCHNSQEAIITIATDIFFHDFQHSIFY